VILSLAPFTQVQAQQVDSSPASLATGLATEPATQPAVGPAKTPTENPAGSPVVTVHAESPEWWQAAKDMASQFKEHAEMIGNEGQKELYLSGYAYHGRNTYTAERISELNEHAWGLGYGKSLYNAKGDEESIYFFTIDDSHGRPQPMAGYVYQWMWPVAKSGLEVGAGYTAMLMSRSDYFGGLPFPALLPVGSIGTKKFRLMASYVPRISQNKGNGDVLLIFFRIAI
jgi:hypothetical protein